MKRFVGLVLLTAAAILGGCQRKDASQQTLRLLCGAGLRPAVEEAIGAFDRQSGIRVETDYAGSGMLVARAKLERDVDLFLPGDLSYIEDLQKEGLIASHTMVTYLVPVILVAKGNPKHVTAIADLTREDVRVGIGRPEACQIGRTTEALLQKNGIPLQAVRGERVVESVNVAELATWVVANKVDAAVVWDAVAVQYATTADSVAIPPEKNVNSNVAVAVMAYSAKKEPAQRFAAFLASDAGKAIFRKHGYQVDPPQPVGAEESAR